MALIADNPADRAEQLVALSQRLVALIGVEADALEAMQAPLSGPEQEERDKLIHLYRLEMARIAQDTALINAAPASHKVALKNATLALNHALDRHMAAVTAHKEVTEGLVQAIAAEAGRQRAGPPAYTAGGGYRAPSAAATAVAVNRSA
jgi:hypothetical protein